MVRVKTYLTDFMVLSSLLAGLLPGDSFLLRRNARQFFISLALGDKARDRQRERERERETDRKEGRQEEEIKKNGEKEGRGKKGRMEGETERERERWIRNGNRTIVW